MNRYQLKSRECIWLLNYMVSDDQMIGLLKFVDNISDCPRALVISEKTVTEEPFLYRKHRVETNEPEKAFHDIRMDQEETIYVHLIFPSSSRCSEYVSILEENPFDKRNLHDWYGREADRLIEQSQVQFQGDFLYKEIDKALEDKDRERFLSLVLKLQQLTKKSKADHLK